MSFENRSPKGILSLIMNNVPKWVPSQDSQCPRTGAPNGLKIQKHEKNNNSDIKCADRKLVYLITPQIKETIDFIFYQTL